MDLAIAFTLPKHLVVKKLMSRRVCPKCNRSYILSEIHEGQVNLPAILPKEAGYCDDCHVPLVVRSDDNPKIIESRYDIFEERTQPVLDFYRNKNILREYAIKQGVQDLPDILRSILIQYLVKYNSGISQSLVSNKTLHTHITPFCAPSTASPFSDALAVGIHTSTLRRSESQGTRSRTQSTSHASSEEPQRKSWLKREYRES